MHELITTISQRYYVFIFLAAYIFLGIKLMGKSKMMMWLIAGYIVAWASEYSSIHIGIPYGEYHYIYQNMRGELMVFGVPFFDSLSYPFMIFAGYSAYLYVGRQTQPTNLKKIIIASFAGAMLTAVLDIIIDPLTKLGDKWFLGKIYYYAHEGYYFGVPLSNFLGWFAVAFVAIFINLILWQFFFSEKHLKSSMLNLFFYLSIAIFNITISLIIGSYALAISSILILSFTFILLRYLIKKFRGVLL